MHKPYEHIPAGQCCELDEPYQAPPGYFDQPFLYVFDADALKNGESRRSQLTTLTGADFLLRRIAGIDRFSTTR